MNIMVSWALIALLIVSGMALVLSAATPALERAKADAELAEAEEAMRELAGAIKTVAAEGNGSSRLVEMPEGGRLVDGNSVVYRLAGSIAEPFTREITAVEKIAGADASCYASELAGSPAWFMENSLLMVALQRVNGTIDTAENILLIRSKAANITIMPQDSSITINGLASSSRGTGFSEMQKATDAPKCRARFHIDSAAGLSYEIFYTLYAGADFVAVEVRKTG